MKRAVLTVLLCCLTGCGDDGGGGTGASSDGAAATGASDDGASDTSTADGGTGTNADAGGSADGAGSGSGDGALDAATRTVSFSADIMPVFSRSCVLCHHGGNATGLDLTRSFDPVVGLVDRENSWTEAAATLLVDPGNPDNSFLVDKVRRTDLEAHVEGVSMPMHIPRLTADEVAVLRQWVTDGANDDALYRDEVTLIFGDGVSLGRTSGKCAFCHNPAAAAIPDLTDPFDPVRGIVGITGSTGTIVAPGDPDGSTLIAKVEDGDTLDASLGAPMPFWPTRLTDDEVDDIVRWIEDGAPDN